MVRCVFPRGSRTSKWLTTLNRIYKASISNSSQQYGSSTPKPSANQQTASAYDIIHEKEQEVIGNVGGLNGVQDSEDRSKPYKPRHLPVSPFMDPEAIAARQKHHLPKLPPSKTPTLFQQQLSKNPYAQALATPMRLCQLTKFRLPNYFLQDFQLMAHPETREPWWVPSSLRKKYEAGEAVGSNEEAGTGQSVASEQDSELPLQLEESCTEVNSPTPQLESEPPTSPLENRLALPSHTPRLGPGTYLLSRQALISAMQNVGSGWGLQSQKNFLSGSIMRSPIAKKVRERASWRTDMDIFILELMRRRVVEGLVYLVWRKRGFVAGCVDWEDTKKASRQQGAILWTGKTSGGEEANSEGDVKEKLEAASFRFGEQQGHDRPLGFATLTMGKDRPHMVPVHNLPMLLGPEHLAELRKKCSIFEKELLIVKNKRTTVDIQMKLWSLQGYLGFPEHEYDKVSMRDGNQGGES